MTGDRLLRFRLRLLAAFSLGLAPGLLSSPIVSAGSAVECYELGPDEDTCLPAGLLALHRLDEEDTDRMADECWERSIREEPAQAVGSCCYSVSGHNVCQDLEPMRCG